MRHESQRERLGPRPWQRPAGRGVRLSLQIGEVRRERPQAILAHAFVSEMLQGFDAIVSQKLSGPIAPVHRQDGHERIEILGAARLRVEMGATLPLTMVSLPVFVRVRGRCVAEIATWIEPVAQATFERLGV
jgi:hypothetical protein